jgi:hypothetical protein
MVHSLQVYIDKLVKVDILRCCAGHGLGGQWSHDYNSSHCQGHTTLCWTEKAQKQEAALHMVHTVCCTFLVLTPSAVIVHVALICQPGLGAQLPSNCLSAGIIVQLFTSYSETRNPIAAACMS